MPKKKTNWRTADSRWPPVIDRIAQGETQASIAKDLGLNASDISKWKKNPHFAKALATASHAYNSGKRKKEDAQQVAETDFMKVARASEICQLELRPPQRRIVEAFDNGAKIAIFGGGNGAGKSLLALREALETCWGMKRWAPKLATVKIIGRDWKQLAQVFKEYLTLYVPEELVETWGTRTNGLPISITFKNGSTLNFGTNEQGWAAHQGQRCNLIIYDEEPDYDVFEEGLARMSREGAAPRVLFTMTPTKGKGWVWDELICRRDTRRVVYETCAIFENGEGVCVACDTPREEWDAILRALRLERDPAESPIYGGRWLSLQLQAIEDLTVSREDGYCHRCWTFGVKPFAEADFIRNQVAFSPNKKRIAMRLLGSWENLDGAALFDGDKLSALEAHVSHPKIDDGVSLQIWEEPRPRNPYVIGVDPARGTGRDETVFQVVNAATGVQAAVWGDNEKRLMAQFYELKSLARRYHRAFCVIENSSSGEGLIPLAEEDESIDLYAPATKNKDGEIRISLNHGLQPTNRNRSRCLTNMIAAINRGLVRDPHSGKWHVVPGREDALYINDPETLRQLSRMFYDEDQKIVSPKGSSSHDDRVLALAFAWEGIRHPSVPNTVAPLRKRNPRRELRRMQQMEYKTQTDSKNPWHRRY